MNTSIKKWRTRVMYGISTLLVILFGLSTRKYTDILPDLVVLHAGDILYASMTYLLCRFMFPTKKLSLAMFISISFCFLIEFSQLYQAEWANNLRKTTPGALVLGRGFLYVDLIRYLIGVLSVYSIDFCIIRQQKKKADQKKILTATQ